MPDFSKRSSDTEIMDDLNCGGDVVRQTLRELEFINKWLGGNAVTMQAVKKLAAGHPGEPIHVVDLGCGSGDMLKLLADWGNTSGVNLQLTGIDANPNIVAYAWANCSDYKNITFETLDIFSREFQQRSFDIAIGTLFYHHFESRALADFFRKLKSQVRLGIVINDIHRHPIAWHSIRMLTNAFSKSSMVKFDAPLSVLRAFSRDDLQQILAGAGITNFIMKWRWAFRWQVIIPV